MLTIAALHDLDVKFFDMGNAHLNAETDEKVFFTAGPEWGPKLAGRIIVVVRALHGLKSAGASFHRHLARTLRDGLGFNSCLADPDTWMRPAVKPDGFKHHECVTTHVDDGMAISDKTEETMKGLGDIYTLNTISGIFDEGARHLGASVGVYDVNASVGGPEESHPFMSAEAYLEKAIPVIESHFDLSKFSAKVPQPKDHHPELDDSPFLNAEGVQIYQSLMGVLCWVVELGRIDMAFAAGLMAQ